MSASCLFEVCFHYSVRGTRKKVARNVVDNDVAQCEFGCVFGIYWMGCW